MTTYTINLDDMDLALLPLRTRTHFYNDFLKNEYYQFQVIKEPAQAPPSDTTYTCHTCAIELPAAFAREHTASIKHRANARIASVAAQRTRALITALPPPAAASTARFCANCATVVDEDHDKTKDHRVAAMHDNLLWELMKAYVGDDESKDDQPGSTILNRDQGKCQVMADNDTASKNVGDNNRNNGAIITIDKTQETNETEDKTGNRETKAVQKLANCEINDKNEKNKYGALPKVVTNNINKTENNQSTNSVLPLAVKLVTKKEENGTSVAKEANVKEDKSKLAKGAYEIQLRKFMDANNVFQIIELYHRVHIKTNDDTANVYSDHFHSFHGIYNSGKVECVVCNKTLERRDIEAHKYDFNHMNVVAKIGDDGNYVREINETHSHCIICNQKINKINVASHKQSQHHTQRKAHNVKTAKTTETTKTVTNNNELAVKTEDNPTRNDVTMEETVEINKHPYRIVSGELQCLVCDCRVPRDLKNREDHLKGLRHVNNRRTLLGRPTDVGVPSPKKTSQ